MQYYRLVIHYVIWNPFENEWPIIVCLAISMGGGGGGGGQNYSSIIIYPFALCTYIVGVVLLFGSTIHIT